MASKRIQIGIGFDINKAALNELSKSLDAIIIKSKMPGQEANAGLQEAAKNASQVANIIEKSFNKELGSFNMTRFNKELSKSGLTLDVLRNSFSKAGKIGEASFNKLGSQILNTNIQLKQSNKLLDDMAESFANTVKWGISSSIFNSVTSAIQKAYDYSVDLNTSLTDIRIVTEYSADAMDKFAEKANTAAKNLGANTLDYTNAALIYYQQGLDEEEVQSRAQTTIKAANVTGQSGAEVSEQLTAVWNGYKVSAQESELYIDKLAAVAAATAADLEELSTGMSKVASAANLMGVDIDQLNAQLATIVSITRQAPESVGTALKTIYARMGDIEAGLDGEVTLDEYTSQMAEMGVYVLNADGKLRDMGEVIEEVGENWSMMSREQQVALSQIMAGTRQYNNLLSLFDNWDDYTEALNTSKTAAGELQRQQDTYMESTQAHLNQLTASWQDLYNELFDEQEVNVLIDGLTNGVQVLENFFETFGGGSKSIVAFGALISNIFSKQIGKAINGAIKNIQIYKDNVALLEEKQRLIASGPLKTAGRPTAESKAAEAQYETELKYARQIQEIQHAITSEEYEQLTAIQQENGELEKQKVLLEAELERGIQNASKQGLNKEELENFLNDPEVDEEFYAEKTYTVTSNRDSMFKEFDNAEKYLKATENIADEYNEIAGSLKIISKYKDSLTDSQKKLIKDLKKEKDLSTSTKAEKNEILKIIERIKKEVNQQVDKATKEQKIAEKMLNTKKQINAIEAKQKDNDNDFDYMMDADKAAADIQAKVNGVVGVASGLVNIFNTVSSAVRILNDETLSAGDKATQLIMLMATSLPMLASQIDNIASSLGHTTPILQGLIAYTQIHNGLKEKSLALQKFENLTAEEKAALTAKNIILDEAGISLEAKKAGAKTVSLQLSGANVTVTEAEAIAYGHANVALGLFNKSLLANMTLMAPVLVLVGALIAAVAGGVIALHQINEANERAAELERARKDLAKSNENYENIKKESEAVKDLATAYEELQKQYEDNNITLSELRDSTYVLAKQYGLEELAVKALTSDYEELTEAIKEAEYQKNKSVINAAEQQEEDTIDTFRASVKSEAGAKIDNRKIGGRKVDTIDLEGMNNPNQNELRLLDDLEKLGINNRNTTLFGAWETRRGRVSLDDFAKVAVENEDALRAVLTKSETKAAKQLLEYLDNNSELLDKVAETREGKYTAQKANIITDKSKSINSAEEYKNARNSAITEAINQGIFENTEEGKKEAKQWAESSLNAISDTIKEYGKVFTFSELSEDIKDEDARAYVQGLSSGQQQALFTSGAQFNNLTKDEIEKLVAYLEPMSQTNTRTNELTESIQTALFSDDEKEQDYSDYISELRATLDENGELKYSDELLEFENKSLTEQLSILEKISDEQNELNAKRLEATEISSGVDFSEEIEKTEEAIVKAQAEFDNLNAFDPMSSAAAAAEEKLNNLKSRLEELENAQVVIKIDLETSQLDYFETKVQDIVSSGQGLQKAAEYISAGFKVKKEDVAALKAVYPELLQKAQVYKDGSVKLNQQVVQAILEGNKAVLLNSRDVTADQLKQKLALLDAEIAFHQKNLDILNATLEGKISETEAEEQLTKNKGEYEENVINALGITQEEAYNQGILQNGEKTKIELQNLNTIGETIEKVSKAYSKMLSGEIVNYEGTGKALFGDVSSYKSSSRAKDVVPELSEELKTSIRKQIADETKQLESLHTARGTYTDLLSQLYAGSTDAITAMNGAANGTGGKKDDGSKNDPDRKDNLEDERDIYHDINIILQQISTELDRLEEQEEKLVGKDLIDNLNEQWGKLQDTIDATNEKIKIARGELARLKGQLGTQGVTFNPDGTIANYAAAYNQQLAAVNAVINHYNSLSAEGQEQYESVVEQAEKNWEEFLDNISEYDELVSETIPELEDDIQAAINEQIEIQIEKFNMEIEIRLDMAEAEREWNEFKNRIIDDIAEDDILGNTQAKLLDYNSYYKDDGTGVIQRNTQHVNDIINQLKEIEATGTSSVYGDNEAQALEDLKTYYEQLMSDLTDVHDLIDEIRESYLDMMDEAQEKFDEQVETYEYIRDLLTHDMDLITMVYGDEAYNKLVDFYEKQEDNYNKQLDFQRQQKDFWKAQMDSLEEGSDEWQKAKENWMSAVEEWNSLVEEAIENLQDKYLNAINNIFANLNDKVTDGLGLEYTKEEWDLINKNADQYLDTINSIFETQQLENKYLDAIDNTDSISAQRKLNDLMKEEIAALEQKDKLTQYDIDRANLKYEIALKQIALEEAQQNKSSMRLRRDSQGNYRYEFVADNEEVSALEDELSVLQNQLYNMDVDQYQNNLDQLYEVWVEFQEKMAEAAQINDPEARAERELLIEQQYGELINGIVNENEVIRLNLHESAFAELAELYDKDLESFENLTAAEKDILLGDMIPQWESAMQQMADAFAGEGGFEPTCEEALGQLNEATKDYEDSLRNVENTAGITFDAIVNGENEAIQTAQGLLQKNNELINAYNQELNAIRNVIAQLNEMINKYNAAKDAANAATQAAYNYWIQSQNQAANAAANAAKPSGSGISSSNAGAGNVSNSGGGGGGSRQGNGSTDVGDVVTYSGKYYYDSYGTAPAGSRYSGVPNGVVIDKVNGNPYGIHIHSADGRFGDLGWVKRSQLRGYDTGGYTGEWGPDGRLALLHQKEIVLNAKDTENLLGAVGIMRDIVDTVGSSVLSRAANIAIGTGIQTPALTNGALEQNVHIEATFPNVQKSVEIEQALDNLINVASQRANRSNKY